MKVSVDYLFFKCKFCPLVKDKGEDFSLGFGRYECTISRNFVSGDTIPSDCPLRKDEEGKIYKISQEVH